MKEMMKINRIIFGGIIGCLAFSCQQLPEDEDLVSSVEEELKVEVRSAEGVEITYPLHLYAFNETGKLTATQTVDDADEEMALPMAKGDYKVVALSGISEEYQIPEKPSLNDVIVLNSTRGAESPLLMGRADVALSRNAETKAKLTLSHVVAALNVTLKNVPSDVNTVQLTLSPLYSSLSMRGEYGGESQKVKVDCALTSPGIWTAEKVYIFPGNGKETTFSILFKMENGTEVTYGYTYKGVPEANKPFNVTGSYSDGVIVGGNFEVNDWDEAIDVEFEFGATVEQDKEDDEEDENNEEESDEFPEGDVPTADLVGVPEVGTIWNGMIVADINESGEDGAELLLMSLDEWEIITSQIDEVTDEYSVNGVSDWRLPTHDEAALLRARFSGDNRLDLNELITEYNEELYGLANGEKERYLCLKEGECYSFQFIGGTRTTKAGDKRSYYVRLVKTYIFKPVD